MGTVPIWSFLRGLQTLKLWCFLPGFLHVLRAKELPVGSVGLVSQEAIPDSLLFSSSLPGSGMLSWLWIPESSTAPQTRLDVTSLRCPSGTLEDH